MSEIDIIPVKTLFCGHAHHLDVIINNDQGQLSYETGGWIRAVIGVVVILTLLSYQHHLKIAGTIPTVCAELLLGDADRLNQIF